MTNTETGTLVLKDQAGNYYLLPQAILEQGRVPAEHRAEVEQIVAAQAADADDDVQGHFIHIIAIAVAGLAAGLGALAGAAAGYADSSGGGSQPPQERVWTGRMQ